MIDQLSVGSRSADHRRCPAGALRRRALVPIASAAACTLCLALAATLVKRPAPLLLWNASTSSPVGLYLVRAGARPRRGETVIAWPPAAARWLAAQRRYLPAGVPLVKPVAAIAGARICAHGRTIIVNGRTAALRRLRDRAGRRMPWWSGCRQLRGGDLFLLSANVPEAFDGRYFGITRASEIIGPARLLWAKPERDSR